MLKNYGQLITGLLIGLVLGLLIAKQVFVKSPDQHSPAPPPAAQQDNRPAEKAVPVAADNSRHAAGIPQKVYDVLKYIQANNQPMPGYVGGRVFSNREEILPREDNNGKPILYHEWDVNPKVEGQNRGTERIITGSDGRAWYTNDHYQSFKEIT
jgi:ribonuclease T1